MKKNYNYIYNKFKCLQQQEQVSIKINLMILT